MRFKNKKNFNEETLSTKDIDDANCRCGELHLERHSVAAGAFKYAKMLEMEIKDKDR